MFINYIFLTLPLGGVEKFVLYYFVPLTQPLVSFVFKHKTLKHKGLQGL